MRRTRIDWDVQPLGIVSDSEIAQGLGVTPKAVANERCRRKIPAASRQRTARDLSRERLEDLHVRRGLSTYDIALVLGRHQTTISDALRRYGIARGKADAGQMPRARAKMREAALQRRNKP